MVAESALDRLACGLGGKTVFPHIMQLTPTMLQSQVHTSHVSSNLEAYSPPKLSWIGPMGPHVHKTTYGPLIDTALYVILLMRANPSSGRGLGPKNLGFFEPRNGTRLTARCNFAGPKKVLISRAQPPPTCPRNGDSLIKSITYGVVQIISP